MTRNALLLIALVSSVAAAEPRVAVHPLDVGPMSAVERDKLKAAFEVMLARLPGIRVAGTRVDEALEQPAGQGCAVRDSCLRFLAEATDSLYGCYVSISIDPLETQATASGRVIRSDGEVTRRTTIVQAALAGRSSAEAGREALQGLLNAFDLPQLPDTIPVEPQPGVAVESFGPDPLIAQASPAPISARKAIGWSLFALGGIALGGGGVLSAVAAVGRGELDADAQGVVPRENAEAAAGVVTQSRIATVGIVAGAAVAAVGLVLALIPDSRSSQLQVAPTISGHGAGLVLSVNLP